MQRADSRFGTKTKMAAWAGVLGLFALSAWQLQSFEAGGGAGLRPSSSSVSSPALSSGGGIILSAGVQRVPLSPLDRMRREAPEAGRAAPSLVPVGAAVPGAALEPLTGASKSSGGAASDAAQPRLVQSVEQRLYSGTNDAVESAHAAALETCSKTPDCSVASSTSRRTDGIFAGSIQMMVPPEAEAFVLGSIGGSLVLEQSSRTGADRTDEYIDLRGRVDGQTTLYNRLADMVAQHKDAKLEDVLRLEQEMARVGTEIDVAAKKARSIEAVTRRTTLALSFSGHDSEIEAAARRHREEERRKAAEADRDSGRRSAGSLIADAFREAGEMSVQSAGAAIHLIGLLAPWALLFVLLAGAGRLIHRFFWGRRRG